MRVRFGIGLVGIVLVFVLGLSPSTAGSSLASHAQLQLSSASALRPSHGGPPAAPLGFLPLHPREFALAKAAANNRAGLGVNGAKPRGGGGGGPTVTGYANVTPSFNGTYQTGLTPPDTTGAIGNDRYLETVNTQYAIYSRSGSLIKSGSLSSLTGISTGLFGYSLSDPQMMFDVKTQRFYYVAVYYDSLFLSDNGIAIGWSKTATPSSSADFCQYAISFGGELPDYPKLGDSSDFLLVGYNQFGNAATTYDGSEFLTLNKPPAGSTCAATTSFSVNTSGVLPNAATPVPANLVDDSAGGGTGYVVANPDLSTALGNSATTISLYPVTTGSVVNGIPVPSFGTATTVNVPSYSMPSSAPQQGSPYLLDTLDGRFEAAVAAVDPQHGGAVAVWTAHAVSGVVPGSQERWYELSPTGVNPLQSGSVGGSLFAWNGAISPDRNGTAASFGSNMAMSVSTSSTTAYPAIQFVTKTGANAQSSLKPLVQATGPSVDFSCSSTTPCRWGDYSGASPDPNPGSTSTVGKVWLANQYNTASGSTSGTSWRTWLFGVTPG
jgi:hypothetical protein